MQLLLVLRHLRITSKSHDHDHCHKVAALCGTGLRDYRNTASRENPEKRIPARTGGRGEVSAQVVRNSLTGQQLQRDRLSHAGREWLWLLCFRCCSGGIKTVVCVHDCSPCLSNCQTASLTGYVRRQSATPRNLSRTRPVGVAAALDCRKLPQSQLEANKVLPSAWYTPPFNRPGCRNRSGTSQSTAVASLCRGDPAAEWSRKLEIYCIVTPQK